MNDTDSIVRKRAFDLLNALSNVHGDLLPWRPLSDGFTIESTRVPLLGPKGIFKPAVMSLPLSITTSPNSPYADAFSEDNLLQYKYRGDDPSHPDNAGLRDAMHLGKPLIYFHGVSKGVYIASWPVYVVLDRPNELTFSVAVDDKSVIESSLQNSAHDTDALSRRRYITAATKVRLHQRVFRERVLRAYRQQCALCRLRHVELLEAAHITPDAEAGGEPVVTNGLSLCKIHHAAFDHNIIGIRPDYIVEVRMDILDEVDGPMLRHGIQGMHNNRIELPRSQSQYPDQHALDARHQAFRAR